MMTGFSIAPVEEAGDSAALTLCACTFRTATVSPNLQRQIKNGWDIWRAKELKSRLGFTAGFRAPVDPTRIMLTMSMFTLQTIW